MSDPYLYEVLFRGQPDGSGAYHVIVAADGVDAFGDPTHAEKIYTAEQAETAGYALPTVISSINSATQKRLDTVTAERDTLTATVQSLTTEYDGLQAELTAAQQQIATLQSQIATMQTPPAAAPVEAPAAPTPSQT